MPKDRLHKILDELREELQTTEALGDKDRTRLHGVVDQIRDKLEDADESKEEDGSVLEALDEAALHFEAEHPRLTKILYQISTLLRSAGLT